MSSITSVQNLPEIIDNPTQNLQKSTFLGRAFHKISDARQYSLQSINHVVQSILSKCTYLVSFGYYNFEEVHPEEHMLKSCFANLFKELQKSALYQRQKIKNNPEVRILESSFADVFKEMQNSALYQRQKIKNNPE